MSTRSMIAFHNGDSVYAIYCHNDGYLDCNGRILLKHYTDIEKVEELIDLGDLSCLGEEIGQKQNFNRPTSHKWCLAYKRDRGDPSEVTDALTFSTVEEAVSYYTDCDYFYLFDGNKWAWRDHNCDWRELTKEDIYA